MDFRAIMPVLKVSDFERSLQFYQDVLGFAVTWRAKDDGVETAALDLGSTAIMLSTGLYLGAGKPGFTGTLYIEMGSGVSEYWERIGTKSPVAWPLAQMEYGTLEFGIRDPDGYTLAFSEQRAG